jgi:hypothetical protein
VLGFPNLLELILLNQRGLSRSSRWLSFEAQALQFAPSLLLPSFRLHPHRNPGGTRFRIPSPISRPVSMNCWCFLVRTRLPSKIPVAPPLPVAWSCKPNTGILTLGSSPMGSFSPQIAGRFTASGQIIVMGRCQPVVRLVLSRRYHSLPRSFNQYCDFSRQYDPDPSPEVLPNGTRVPPYSGPGVRSFIRDFGRYDLLDYSAYASWFIHLADLIA